MNCELIATTHFARVRRDRSGYRGTFLVWGNDKALLQVAQKRKHRFLIRAGNRMERHRRAQGTTLGRPSFQERTEHKDKRPSGELVGPATNLLFRQSTTSVYSNSGVLQGHKPPTSATYHVSQTTQPHWLFNQRCGATSKCSIM